MSLAGGRFGAFYGCTEWSKTGCRGSVSANPDGSLAGRPAPRATRTARKLFALKAVVLKVTRRRLQDILRALFGPDVPGVGFMDELQCERASKALDEFVRDAVEPVYDASEEEIDPSWPAMFPDPDAAGGRT
jgi:hypothetical protein